MFVGQRVLVGPESGKLMSSALEKYIAARKEIAPSGRRTHRDRGNAAQMIELGSTKGRTSSFSRFSRSAVELSGRTLRGAEAAHAARPDQPNASSTPTTTA